MIMAADATKEIQFEIGHVLIHRHRWLLQAAALTTRASRFEKLREIVRGTEQFRFAEAEGKLLRLPTGDGGALVFRTNPEAPVLCALEIARR